MKIILLFGFLLLGFNSSYSQTLVTTQPQNKNVVLEEFTGIHCGWCPEGHKIAEALAAANPDRVVIVNVHQGNFAVPSSGEPDFRTVFGDLIAAQAHVDGYPEATVNRHYFNGLCRPDTIAMDRNVWNTAADIVFPQVSPVNIGVQSSFDSASRVLTVQVELYYTSNSSSPTNMLNVALLENHVIGPQASGGNNYDHKHILRTFLTGQWGDEILTTIAGSFETRNYTYTVPAGNVIENCDIAAYVAESHTEILTGINVKALGGTTIPIGEITQKDNQTVLLAKPLNTSTFPLNIKNDLNFAEKFNLTISSDAPIDWKTKIKFGSNDYDSLVDIILDTKAGIDINIGVTPGQTPAVATYKVKLESKSLPNSFPKIFTFYVVSNVTDLVVNNSNNFGDGTNRSAKDFQQSYFDGLKFAGVATCTSTMSNVFEQISLDKVPDGIKNIYFNVSWTFPCISDQMAAVLSKFLDAGGNLFISGQDIGWDINDSSTTAHGTQITRDFYLNYLSSTFIEDGSTTYNTLTANDKNPIFKNVAASGIINAYGDGSNGPYMYPDVIKPIGTAKPAFFYNSDKSKCGGIINTDGHFRVVYLAVSLEMLQDSNVTREQIIKQSHDWFEGLINSVELRDALNRISLGINYPNPVDGYTIIPVQNNQKELVLRIVDIFGNNIQEQQIQPGTSSIKINTSKYITGLYFYRLYDGIELIDTKPMQIVH